MSRFRSRSRVLRSRRGVCLQAALASLLVLGGLAVGLVSSTPPATALTTATIVNTNNDAWMSMKNTASGSGWQERTAVYYFLVRHDPTASVTGVSMDLNNDNDFVDVDPGGGNVCTGVHAGQCGRETRSANSGYTVTRLGAGLPGAEPAATTGDYYSLVSVRATLFDPGAFTSGDKTRQYTAKAFVSLSVGGPSQTVSATWSATTNGDQSGEDYPRVTNIPDDPDTTIYNVNGTASVSFGADDADSPFVFCGNASCTATESQYRFRRVTDGLIQGPTNLDIANDSPTGQAYTVNLPSQPGRWILEARISDGQPPDSSDCPDGALAFDCYFELQTYIVDDISDPSTPTLSASPSSVTAGTPVVLTPGNLVDPVAATISTAATWSVTYWPVKAGFTGATCTTTNAGGSFDRNYGTGSPGCGSIGSNNFTDRWTTTFSSTYSGGLGFTIGGDDGDRLYITGGVYGTRTLLINDWSDHGYRTTSGTATLTAGATYTLEFEHYEGGSDARASLTFGATPGTTTGGIQVVDFDATNDGNFDARYVSTQTPYPYTGFPSAPTYSAPTNVAPGTYTAAVRVCDNGITICGDLSGFKVATATYSVVNPSTVSVVCSPPVINQSLSGTAPTSSTCTATVNDAPPGGVGFGPGSLGAGTVSFTRTSASGLGSSTLASCTLPAGPATTKTCSATFSSPFQDAWTVQGAYAGDSLHAASPLSAGTTVFVRNLATPTLSCVPDPLAYDASGTCTALLTDSTTGAGTRQTVPTGSVSFTASGGTLGAASCTLVAASANTSSCSVSYTNPAHGTPSVTATYAGSNDHIATVTATDTVNIQNSSSTSVSCTTPVGYDAGSCTVTVTDTATGPGSVQATPTGTATLSATGGAGTVTFGSCTLTQLVANLSASCTVSATTDQQDSYSVTAAHVANNDHGASVSSPVLVKFGARATSISVSCSPSTVVAGTPTTCTATVTDVEPSGTQVSPAGTVTFGQSGGGTFSPSTSCVLAAGASPSSSCSVQYTPTFSGSHTVNAFFASNTSGAAAGGFKHKSASSTSFPVGVTGNTGRHSTSTSVSCTPNPVAVGSPTTCTATVTDTYTFGPKSTPTGTVQWGYSGGGSFSSSTCTLTVLVANQSSKCSVTYTPASAGNKTVNAFYKGTPTHFTSYSGSVAVVATSTPPPPPPTPVRHPTSMALVCSPSSVPLNTATTCTATVTDTYTGTKTEPTGTVTFGYSGGGTLSPPTCTLVGNGDGESSACATQFTPTGSKGNKTVNATYNGTPAHKKSVSGSIPVTAT